MKYFKFVLFIVLLGLLFGCSEQVPPGYNGMIMTPEGLTGKILPPGRHTCWGRDKMVLWEKAEVAKTEQLKILCADDLNFTFDLKLRGMIDADKEETITYVLDKQGSRIQWDGSTGKLAFDTIYDTYIKDPARSTARKIVSRYETTQIRDQREQIEKAIAESILVSMKNTPVKITYLATSNFDYPEVVTKAVEARRKREIEIGEEKAKQAMELLKMDNREALAEKRKSVRMKEAEADGIYMQILGKYLTPEYLKLRAIERDIVLYEKVGTGDKVIVTNGNAVSPFIDSRSVQQAGK